jgi:GT2 family glycosyltransferase
MSGAGSCPDKQMKKGLPFVSIVVTNYNGRRFLKDCLDSLFDLDYPKNKLEVIMVDNGSSDGSLNYVKENYLKVILLENNVNNYARANNMGIKKAKGKYVAFVNNDVRVDKGWLIELIKIMNGGKLIGAAGGKILMKDGRIQSVGHEDYPDFYWGDRGFRDKDKGQYDQVEEVISLCGAAVLFRKRCLEDVGCFDEDFVMYLEDIDICFRCTHKKWKIFYNPKSIAYHNFRGTSSPEVVEYFSERNRLLTLAKHFPDKLGDALYGKGYFSEYSKNKGRNIFDILPIVFKKLIEFHKKEITSNSLISIFCSLKRISNLEKGLLLNQLESKDGLLKQKESSLEELRQANNQLGSRLDSLLQELESKDGLLKQKESSLEELRQANNQLGSRLDSLLQELESKDGLFQEKIQELEIVKNDLERIIRLDKKMKFLVIKPQRITVEDTELIIKGIKRKYPNSSIDMLANLLPEDGNRLSRNKEINKIFQPAENRFSFWFTIKYLFVFWLTRFDVALALSSRNQEGYSGFKKAKFMALLSFPRSWHIYYVD